jgi:phosphoglycerate dehydrogenase-like enzyme
LINMSSFTLWTDVELQPRASELLGACSRIVAGSTATLESIDAADAIIASSLLPANAALFARAPHLQVIARVGAGFDNVDLDAATAAGVCAVNTPEAPTESAAEFTIGLLLAVVRRLAFADRHLRAGEWRGGAELRGFDLAGRTLGLVGAGRIGRRVAELALAFRMRVKVFDPAVFGVPTSVELVPDLEILLGSSDIVSLHVPLNAATRHLLDARAFALMKPGAVLLNTSRGAVVDEAALVDALRRGHLAGAGIDVWDPEPPRADHPLFGFPSVVVTPHMAALTSDGQLRSHLAAATQVLQVWRGERPPGLLNPAVWPQRRSDAKVL